MVNISQESGAFFQTDAELARLKEKEQKYNYSAGDAIELSSKALDILLSTDEKYLFVAEAGYSIRRISLATNKTVKVYKGHQGPVTAIACSENILWTGSWDKTIKKWDIKSGECLATLTGHTDFVKSLLLIGNMLYSGSSDCFIRKWNTETLECLAVEKRHKRAIESMAVSLDGKFMYSASSDGTVIKWDAPQLKVVKTYTGHDTSIYCVRVWEDDLWSASADKTVRRWNAETGVEDMVLQHPDRVKTIVLAGPYIISGSSDDEIRVWDIGSGKLLCTIEGHFDEVGCLAVTGSTLYSGSLDCSIRRWSLTRAALKEYNEAKTKKPVKKPVEEKQNGLTEEEERELAELMLSDEE